MATAAPPRRLNWVEYGLEAWALGLFMVSACGFGVLLFHPASPVVGALQSGDLRRALMGLAMGATAVLNVYSPWGRRSGAHLNPATTLAFYRLGKVARTDLAGYVAAHFAGGIGGTYLAAWLLDRWIADPAVNFVATVPGPWGVWPAFLGELAIAFLLLTVVLALASRPRLARYTGLVVGVLVWGYITFEAPLSGMSMNPARTLSSALPAETWTGLWVYFVAPPAGMLLAAELGRWRAARGPDHCAKLHHDERYRCIFCEFRRSRAASAEPRSGTRA